MYSIAIASTIAILVIARMSPPIFLARGKSMLAHCLKDLRLLGL